MEKQEYISCGLDEIEIKLEQAGLMLLELVEDYFERFDTDTEEGRMGCCIEFGRNKIKTDIALNIILDLQKKMKSVKAEEKEAA